MQKGGFFRNILEAMGIVVDTTEGTYDPDPADYESYEDPIPAQEPAGQTLYTDEYAGGYENVYQNNMEQSFAQQPVFEEAPTPANEEVSAQRARESHTKKGNVINMHNQTVPQQPAGRGAAQPVGIGMSVVVFRPNSVDDTERIVDHIRTGSPVIVNLESQDEDDAQRFLDFLSGGCYALNAKVHEVAAKIFLLAPYNVDITDSMTFAGQQEAYYGE